MALATSNLTSGFIDLATYDEVEKYLYGGPDATAYFVRETRKSTWFTQVPVTLSRGAGTAAFGQEWSANISRAGDYLLYSWLRVTIPAVALTPASVAAGLRIRWTRNLMHNLIAQAQVTFNDLVAHQFDNYYLDFWAAFTVPAGKRNGYNNMVGNIPELINSATSLPQVVLNLPLPFFYTRDSGVALPTAALPYNEMKIQFKFRDWNDLLIVDNLAAAAGTNPSSQPSSDASQLTATPSIVNANVWSNYAIVSNDERKRMACAPRDILMEQTQIAPFQTFAPATNPTPNYDIRFSHAIKVLFFGIRNKTTRSQWSNYTAAQPLPGVVVDFNPSGAVDPIETAVLIYENTSRLGGGTPDSGLGADYYSLINPWYHAPVIPLETGYHMYSYSLDFYALDPIGSTNYGKLTNVSLGYKASPGAIIGANGTGLPGSGQDYVQNFDSIILAVNNNIIRVSGGALGFPVL
jgi:hypothetical protein